VAEITDIELVPSLGCIVADRTKGNHIDTIFEVKSNFLGIRPPHHALEYRCCTMLLPFREGEVAVTRSMSFEVCYLSAYPYVLQPVIVEDGRDDGGDHRDTENLDTMLSLLLADPMLVPFHATTIMRRRNMK
jgi:hypothetical protein